MSEAMSYDALFGGEVIVTAAVPAAAGTYARGDLMECTVTSGVPAATFHKATAAAVAGNIYMIAAEAKTLAEVGTMDTYGAGYYDIAKVGIVGDETTNKLVLLSQGIVLKACQTGE